MKIIEAGYEILTPIDGLNILKHIERIGRVCYKSEDKITDDSSLSFVKMLINRGHEAMIEHYAFSVKFICDRGISHEIVRHRPAAYAQESTRFCNYSDDKFNNEITVIKPCFLHDEESDGRQEAAWLYACKTAEQCYFQMIKFGASPQEARSVLPNSLKTEIICTYNLREWRHFLKLRTSCTAHPQMIEILMPLLLELRGIIPIVFDDIL